MNTESRKPTIIGNLLYTTEGGESRERTKAELGKSDPDVEKAVGILSSQVDGKGDDEEKSA